MERSAVGFGGARAGHRSDGGSTGLRSRRRKDGVHSLPAVPRGGGAMRAIGLAERLSLGCWRCGQVVDPCEPFSHTEIVDGPDVRPAQLEQQKNIGGRVS